MKRAIFYKKLAKDFLSVVPEFKGQEEVIEAAQPFNSLKPFIEAVRRLQEDRGIAKVITAHISTPLTAHDRKSLTEKLSDQWHMPVILEEKIDASIIGGIKLVAPDWEYDASIEGQLDSLSHAFQTSTL